MESPSNDNPNFNPKTSKRYLTLSLSLLAAGILLLMSVQFIKGEQTRTPSSAEMAQEEVSFTQLQDLNEQQRKDLDVLFRKIQAQENYILELEKKLDQGGKIAEQTPKAAFSESEVLVQALKDEKNTLQVKLTQTQNELMNTKVSMDKIQEDLSQERLGKSQSMTEMQTLAINLEEESKKLQEQTQYAHSLEEKMKGLLEKHNQVEELLDQTSEEKNSFRIRSETLEQALKVQEQKTVAAEEILNKVMEEYKDTSLKLQTTETALNNATKEQQQTVEQLLALNQSLDEVKGSSSAEKETLHQEKAEVVTQYEDAKTQLAELKGELEALINARQKDANQSKEVLSTLNNLQQTASEKEMAYEQLQSQLKAEQEKNQALTQEVNKMGELELAYEKEKRLRQQQDQHFTKLAQSLDQQKSSLQKLLESKENLRKEYDMLKTAHLELLKQNSNRPSSSNSSALALNDTPIRSSISFNSAPSQRMHTVSRGDTLTGISMEYYGTTKKWREIYEANKSTVTDMNRLKIGSNLIIP